MSFLRKGARRRGKVAAALTTVGALAVFQALAIVGAGAAFAVVNCAFAAGTLTVTIDADTATIEVDSVSGDILVNAAVCGTATSSNTTTINVTGTNANNEDLIIDELAGGPIGAATWNIDLGETDGDDDDLSFELDDGDDTLVLTNTSFNLNGAVGTLVGVDEYEDVDGNDGDDTLDGSAASIEMELNGGDDNDTLAPGTFDGDSINPGGGTNTLDYSSRTTATVVLQNNVAGFDSNGDDDLDDAGDEDDSLGGCFDDHVFTGSGNDFVDDNGCFGTYYALGLGDDDLVNDNNADKVDYSHTAGAVTIDVDAQTSTGQGADTWEGAEQFVGSAGDDLMVGVIGDLGGPDNVSEFSGQGGTDTVDATADANGVRIDLDQLDPDNNCSNPNDPNDHFCGGPDDLENAIGGAGNDALRGNDLRNNLNGAGGDDTIRGRAGNDTLIGGPGNDAFEGGDGADRVSFKTNTTAGVTVDLSLGFATSSDSGDDSFDDLVEIIIGSNFKDTITGGPFGGGGTVNFLFKGLKKADILTGFNGNDTLRGGPGGDTLRGVGGDDTIKAGKGADLLAGGNGFDVGRGGPGRDDCRSIEDATSCF
jgi:Ca2+-binding RTX toxin-like protein